MKVLIVTETFLPSTDGIVTRLCKAIEYMLSVGHTVKVIAPDLGITSYKGAEVIGVKSFKLPLYRFRKWSLPSKIVGEVIDDFMPDIIHAVNPTLLATSGVYYAKQRNISLVCSYHTHLPKYLSHYHLDNRLTRKGLWNFIRYQHRDANVNLCTSEAMYEVLSSQSINNLSVLRRGVDLEERHPRYKSETMRNTLTQNKPDKKLLVFIGRLAPEKEIHKLKPLMEARDDIALAIIGDGPAKDSLCTIFEGTHTLFTGFMYGEQLSKAFASADAFIFPSVSETLGLVILEGMASGLPVIAAESGPTCEQIDHLKTGIIYDGDDLESLIEAVSYLDDDDVMKCLKQNARNEAMQYGWENASLELIQYYERAIENQYLSNLIYKIKRDLCHR